MTVKIEELKNLDEKSLQIYNQLVKEKKVDLFKVYVLWLLGSPLGLYNFYLGRNSIAKAQLITSIVSTIACAILIGFIGLAAVVIWNIVDLFSIQKYVNEANENIERKVYDEVVAGNTLV